MRMIGRAIAKGFVGGALVVVVLWPAHQPAAALPLAASPHAASLVEPAKRCPHGYRKSTVTGRCVRIGSRWPIFWLLKMP
ncbi:MAG TPA: hypothetical protein VG966_00605 [Hyphomicrobiaceae bacterium]|nr:hypothetical protein [Hyphomicrobiaceae bacterium]